MKFIATKGSDKIEIEVTDEGLIKLSADKVSQEAHSSVESIYALVSSLAGGSTRRTLKPNLSLQQALHAHMHEHGINHHH